MPVARAIGDTGYVTEETIIPLLPCRDIDEIIEFYRMIGFERTYRQTRPNPYVALERGGIALHFFGIQDFDPEQSYGSCIITVPDTGELFETFAAGMRSTHGKLLLSGIPRITRPRKRKNTGNASGFTVIDPGGNWIRIFRRADDTADPSDTAGSPLGRALENAVVLGESKGDARQAAKILDGKLSKNDAGSSVIETVQALVYRTELAIRLEDPQHAGDLLRRVRNTALDDVQRQQLSEALDNAAELENVVRTYCAS